LFAIVSWISNKGGSSLYLIAQRPLIFIQIAIAQSSQKFNFFSSIALNYSGKETKELAYIQAMKVENN